ncbi:Protein CBG03003 [Caenorhabditis briggsae]|uniref:DNA-directed RNA polymerase III subunit RPC9 n=1 Tax=Caenorhabditis briggsae TaxID=6238 RepID=A8WT08_CAEBR|nr:Protein CBG03003 [Caenorhabditis briggsae]CAP23619.2 Protein CBG03003 [Caenorhabditis briggsae]
MEVLKQRVTVLTNQEVLSFLNAVKKEEDNKLTGAETLQVVNMRPANTTDIQLLVEETEERFPSEEELEKLITTITDCLPPPPKR